jgi:hypothetical protein
VEGFAFPGLNPQTPNSELYLRREIRRSALAILADAWLSVFPSVKHPPQMAAYPRRFLILKILTAFFPMSYFSIVNLQFYIGIECFAVQCLILTFAIRISNLFS